jgi:hypothetical protein
MTKKRLLLIASLPLVIVVTVGVLAMMPPRPGVTKANFDRVEKGMTRAEVEEIFGEKGDVWYGVAQVGQAMLWTARNGSTAIVEFVDECVAIKQWTDSNETLLAKIRRWLHLR